MSQVFNALKGLNYLSNNTQISYQSQLINIVNVEGTPRVDSRLIADRLGIQHKNLMENISKYANVFHTLGSLPFETETRKRNIGATQIKYALLNEDQTIFALTLSRNTPQVVQLKLDLTVAFKNARQSQQPTTQQPAQLDAEITIAKAAADMLRMSDDSKLKMLYQISDTYNFSTAFLPDYTESSPTKALTVLLKEHDSKVTIRSANKILVELGIIEKQTRPSTKKPDEMRDFWSITEIGLQFGKNLVSPNNPRETQPHYYCDTFPKLLARINSYLMGAL